MDKKIFFIIGRGRSGTTLLSSILTSHPKICVAYESLFAMLLYNKYKKINYWSKDIILSFYNDLWKEEKIKDWQLDKKKLKEELLALEGVSDYGSIVFSVYKFFAKQLNKGDVFWIGDKNPHYSLFLTNLIKLFPKAKFIHIVRNPFDNVYSYLNVPFDSNNYITLAHRWKLYNNEIVKFTKIYKERVFFLKYEQLIENPSIILKKICKFLSIEYSQSMEEFYKIEQNITYGNYYFFLRKITSPIDKQNKNKWKNYFSQKQTKTIFSITHELMETFDYKYEFSSYNNNFSFKYLLGIIHSYIYTYLEKLLFYFPFDLRTIILHYYRKITGTLQHLSNHK